MLLWRLLLLLLPVHQQSWNMVGATGGEDRLAAVHLSVVQHVCVSCMPVLQTYISLCLTFMLSVSLFLVGYDMHCTVS